MKSNLRTAFAVSLLTLAINGAVAGEVSQDEAMQTAAAHAGFSLQAVAQGSLAAVGTEAATAATSTDISAAQLGRAQQKLAHAVQVADQFADRATTEGLPSAWRIEMISALMKRPESSFSDVQAQSNVRDAIMVAAAPAATSSATAKVLGDIGDDLTFIPLPAPCRIVDTRAASPLVAGTPQNFSFTSANSSQGGSGCSPFTGYVGGGVPGAAALNITVIGGASAVPGSFLQAYPGGGSTTTSWLNFGANQVIANEGILGISTSFVFTLKTNASANAIVDVFGSFVRPAATALDCVTTASTSLTLNTTTRTGNASAPACAATYTRVSTHQGANGDYANVYTQIAGDGYVFWYYGGSSSVNPLVYAKCCRVPGR